MIRMNTNYASTKNLYCVESGYLYDLVPSFGDAKNGSRPSTL